MARVSNRDLLAFAEMIKDVAKELEQWGDTILDSVQNPKGMPDWELGSYTLEAQAAVWNLMVADKLIGDDNA